jgi:hypothetical protein
MTIESGVRAPNIELPHFGFGGTVRNVCATKPTLDRKLRSLAGSDDEVLSTP